MRIWKEEEACTVPLLSSTEYGRFSKDTSVDVFKFFRPLIPCMEQEFFSPTGVIPEVKVPRLQTIPGSRPANTEDEKKFYK